MVHTQIRSVEVRPPSEHPVDPPPPREGELVAPLLEWLRQTRRINTDSHIAFELPWFGRRIDVVTLTSTRLASAYELKVGGLSRALEQASYNRLAFDRSYVVTTSLPRDANLELAAKHGIGVIVVTPGRVTTAVESPLRRATPELRSRLLRQVRQAASSCRV